MNKEDEEKTRETNKRNKAKGQLQGGTSRKKDRKTKQSDDEEK